MKIDVRVFYKINQGVNLVKLSIITSLLIFQMNK